MKSILLLSFALMLPALATPPQKPAKSRYAPLWINSPFTAKPVPNVPIGPPPVNPMDDYALGGVAQMPDGYFVILINKKNPQERETIQPGVHSKFKVLDVNMGIDKISEDGILIKEGASVKLSAGSMEGEVTYDDKIMAIKATPNVPAPNGTQNGIQNGINNNRPILPPGANLPNPAANNSNIRQPRLRTIPPPTVPQPQSSAPQLQQNQQGQNIRSLPAVQQ